MPFIQAGHVETFYKKVGSGPTLVLLHGWANTHEAFAPLVPLLSKQYTLILPDLPHFGETKPPESVWDTQQYVEWLADFITKLDSPPIALIGHSYGGKVASVFASRSEWNGGLILIDASGIPSTLTGKQKVLRTLASITPTILKQLLPHTTKEKLYSSFSAESDYLHAKPIHKEILKKILPEDIRPNLKKIVVPTLLLWGTKDKFPPYSHGIEFNKLITSSTLLSYETGHFPHHEQSEQIARDILAWIADHKIAERQPSVISSEESARPHSSRLSTSTKLQTLLAILQQAEYDFKEFATWYENLPEHLPIVAPKKWTGRLVLTQLLTQILTPFIGMMSALKSSNQIISFPRDVVIRLIVILATLKLRYYQSQGLIVVAIAGSFAKTSTRHILVHTLKATHNTLQTPENYNTPIGIAKTILASLSKSHQVFVTELGEYYPGDIKELVQFVRPAFKILTPIGYAHLGKFKTEDNLEQGLLELVTTTPHVPSLIHSDNLHLVSKHAQSHLIFDTYGEQDIQSVTVSRAGTEFTRSHDTKTQIFIPLFGKHNAINTLPSFWLGRHLHQEDSVTIGRLSTLLYIPHRLEPTVLQGNILLLDNGYNSNPKASEESLQVLHRLSASVRIVCTPGFVDLGSAQQSANKELGKHIAKVANTCVVISSVNQKHLIEGLKAGGFTSAQIVHADTETEGMEKISSLMQPNAIVLFENSVPELYKN